MKKHSILFALTALAPAAGLAAPLPANLPVYGQAPGAVPPPNMVAPATAAPAMEMPAAQDPAAPMAYMEAEPRYAWSMDFLYGISASPRNQFATDVFGVEGQFAWIFAPHHALTFDISYAGGTDRERLAAMDGHHAHWNEHYRFYRSRLSFLGGYEFRHHLNPQRSAHFYLSAKAGLDNSFMHVSNGDYHYGPYGCYYEHFHTRVAQGLAYAFGAGVSFSVGRNCQIDVGYQYFGSTAEPEITYHSRYTDATAKLKARSMRWHEIHAGVSVRF